MLFRSVRYSDFTTITRSHTTAPTRREADVIARALQLLDKTDAGHRPVRLLGVSVHNFCGELDPADQPDRLLPFGAVDTKDTQETKDTKEAMDRKEK